MNTEQSEFNRKSLLAAAGAAVGVMVTIGPITVSTFGIFLSAITKQFGWSRSGFSLAILICAIVGGIVTPMAGRMIDRWGARRVMLPAVGLFGLAVMTPTLMQGQLWQFYLCYCLVGITAGFQNMVAYSKVISQWFQRRRGRMLSLVSACYGVCYAVLPKLVQPVVQNHGWRAGYWFLGFLVLVALVPVSLLLRTPDSEERSQSAQAAGGSPSPSPDIVRAAGLTAREAIRTREFWIIVIILICGVTSLVGTISHLFPLLLDRKYSPGFAASVLSVFAVGGVVAQLSYGFLVDRFQLPQIALPYFVSALVGLCLVHYATASVALLVGAGLIGIGQGSELGLAAYFCGRYFGIKFLGEIYGYIYAAATLASGIGPVLMGYAFDRSGTYSVMLYAFQAALLVACVGIVALRPYVFAAVRARS